MRWSICLLACAVFTGAVSQVCVADDWSITTADFQTQQVQLQSVNGNGIGVSTADSKSIRTIDFDDFVSLRRSGMDQPQSAAFTLMLTNGDRLTGTPGAVERENLTWTSPTLGVMSISLSRIARLSRGLDLSAAGDAPKQDVVTLANGDTVAGVFVNCADSKVTFQTDAATSTIPLETIRNISLASTGAVHPNIGRRFQLRLGDGSSITTSSASVNGDQVSVMLPGEQTTRLNFALNKLAGIEQVNGPICWLSSCEPVQQVQVPFLAGARDWPARFDLAVDGSPLDVEGQIYDHGIGVHAFSRLTFAIDPQWKIFRTQYAIDSNRSLPRRYADVTVRVLLDGKLVHEQLDLREGILSPVVIVDLQSAKTLTLECDYGSTGDTQAHLDWLQAAFLKQVPRATTLPATAPVISPATSPSTSPSTSQPVQD